MSYILNSMLKDDPFLVILCIAIGIIFSIQILYFNANNGRDSYDYGYEYVHDYIEESMGYAILAQIIIGQIASFYFLFIGDNDIYIGTIVLHFILGFVTPFYLGFVFFLWIFIFVISCILSIIFFILKIIWSILSTLVMGR